MPASPESPSSPSAPSRRSSPRAPEQRVDAGAREQRVGALVPTEAVVPRAAFQPVAARPAGERWTEEYQARLYVHQAAMLRRIPFLAGVTPWILKDFRSPRRPLPVRSRASLQSTS